MQYKLGNCIWVLEKRYLNKILFNFHCFLDSARTPSHPFFKIVLFIVVNEQELHL